MIIKNPSINKSIEYILQNIDNEIFVEDVANYCNYSKYHFSRIFKKETGLSIYNFIKGIRIDQSAVSLKIEKDKTITDIGAEYGYSSSNYSSLFSKEYDICPVKFRKAINLISVNNPFYSNKLNELESFNHYNDKISIKKINDIKVICERYIGSYGEIGGNWSAFRETYKEYITPNTILIEKSYNDPSISKLDKCVYDLCIRIDDNIKSENTIVIRGGNFAIYQFHGYIEDIFPAFQGFLNIWLPNSGYKRSEIHVLGIYQNIDIKNNYVVIDLCIPIKESKNSEAKR